MDDHQFRRLLDHLELSWAGYRKVRKGVKKRIRRHMREMNCSDISEYLLELNRNKEARNECEQLMTFSISRFFRDKKLWEILERQILPDLIKSDGSEIPVWCAGCASGEEAYSLKILWDSLILTAERSPELIITATDMNPVCLERAMAGIYTASSLKEVPEKFRSAYFMTKTAGKRYVIKDSLKRGVSWRLSNLLYDTPESQFQVVFLRNNLLTYYQDKIIKTALENIITCLYQGGFLIIGSHERLPFEINGLSHYESLSYIFKKQA